MMLAENIESHAFMTICSSLMLQLESVGLFLMDSPRETIEALHPALGRRLAFTSQFFMLMQHACQLRCGDGEYPVLYNSRNWPYKTIAGLSSAPECIRPSDLASSFFGTWELSCMALKEGASTIQRYLKATLWHSHIYGWRSGLRYYATLLRRGYVIDDAASVDLLALLCEAYQRAGTDNDMTTLFFPSGVPQSADEIANEPVHIDDWIERSAVRPVDGFISELFDICLEMIEGARHCKSYDEWLLRQWVICTFVGSVLSLAESHGLDQSLGMRAIMSYLEENKADSAAVRLTHGKAEGLNVLGAEYTLARGLMKLFMYIDKDDWHERVGERSVIPYALADRLASDDWAPEALPAEWRQMSIQLAPIFALTVCETNEWQFASARTFANEEGARGILIDLIRESEALPHEECILRLTEFIRSYPWCPSAYQERGIHYDQCGAGSLAIEDFISGVILLPNDEFAWECLGIALGRGGYLFDAYLAKVVSEFVHESKGDGQQTGPTES
jgi:hypothetical protein